MGTESGVSSTCLNRFSFLLESLRKQKCKSRQEESRRNLFGFFYKGYKKFLSRSRDVDYKSLRSNLLLVLDQRVECHDLVSRLWDYLGTKCFPVIFPRIIGHPGPKNTLPQGSTGSISRDPSVGRQENRVDGLHRLRRRYMSSLTSGVVLRLGSCTRNLIYLGVRIR